MSLEVSDYEPLSDAEIAAFHEDVRGVWQPSGTDQMRLLATIEKLRARLAEVEAERDRMAALQDDPKRFRHMVTRMLQAEAALKRGAVEMCSCGNGNHDWRDCPAGGADYDLTEDEFDAQCASGEPALLAAPPCGCTVDMPDGFSAWCPHGTYIRTPGAPLPPRAVVPHEYVKWDFLCHECRRPESDPDHSAGGAAGEGETKTP